MKKRFISVLLVFIIILSFGAVPVNAVDDVVARTVYDFTGKNYKATYVSSGHWYPNMILDDGTTVPHDAITFRNRNNVKVAAVDGSDALCYYYVSGKDTYAMFYSTSDGNIPESTTGGRTVITTRFYTSTNKLNATFKANGADGYYVSTKLFEATDEAISANTWYVLKITVDTDAHKIRYSFAQESPKSSSETHTIAKTVNFNSDTFNSVRLDLDIIEGTSYNSETGEGDFCAYDDFKLTYNTHSTVINAVSNGNTTDTSYNKGIFTASASGSGLFAVALYKEDSIKKLVFIESEEELEEMKLNLVIDDMDTTMKIFRFDSDGTPICINKYLTPDNSDYRIYVNETFTDGSEKVSFNDTTKVLSDGRVILSKTTDDQLVRFGTFPVNNPDSNIIIEADFELPSGVECFDAKLISMYRNSPQVAVYLGTGGIRAGASGKLPTLVSSDEIEALGKFNVAMKIDVENYCYDVYFNEEKITTEPVSLSACVDYDTRYNGFSIYVPTLEAVGSIYVDNIRAYSGTEFIDIDERIANVNALDFDDNPLWESEIYQRPEYADIASRVLEAGHPRLLINKAKVNEINSSDDSNISRWRSLVMSAADSALETEPYEYRLSNTGSLGDISESLSLMMNLGFAYLSTGDTRYSDRAYEEAEVLFTVPYIKAGGTLIEEEDRDYWNSYSYLDVAEVSAIISICYDWMYDAWTDAQKDELCDIMTKYGLLRHYKSYFGEIYSLLEGSTNWWKSTNNWNAVCNGGALLSAIAFMEEDPYLCANIAKSAIRGFEYLLPNYAPSGAWAEGAGYWAYALKYLTASCATLDISCGTDYGISKTTGLENSQFYSLSLEGKTGVVNFGDVGGSHVDAPFMFYWANKYQNSEIGGAALYIKDQFGYSGSIFDLIYYNPDYVTDSYIPPLTFYYQGTEVVSLTSGYENDDSYIAISGGKGVATSHDHLDSGSVVVEKNGNRVIYDSGAEHYGAASYFSTNRYWYYKARPEGHNIFVINPQNITNGTTQTDGETVPVYYHGQDRNAVSEIAQYNKNDKLAVMDLSEAYARDASSAARKIYLDGDDVIIEDDITLLSDGNLVEWYFHYKDTAGETINGSNKYLADYGTAVISEDKKSVTLTYKEYTVSGSALAFTGETKTYTISFEANCDYEIEIRDAVRNSYDSDVVSGLISAGSFSGDYHNSRNVMSKIVVKMTDVSGSINLKTTIK